MKRMLTAATLAIGIHACLLWADFGWIERKPFIKPEPQSVTLTLVSRPMPKTEPAPIHPIPATPPAPAPDPISKPKPEPKSAPKPIPKPDHKPRPEITRMRAPETKTAAPSPEEPKPSRFKPENEPAPYSRAEPITAEEKTDAPASLIEPESMPRSVLKTEEQKQAVSAGPVPATPSPAPIREAKPRYRDNPSPLYPILARKRGYQGTVVLNVFIDKNGRVADMMISSSSGYLTLDKAARATVENWLFEPGMKGEEKIEMWVKVPIRFQLK